MADNTTLNSGSGGDVIATDDIGGVKYQRVKVDFGSDGSATDVDASNPLPVSTAGPVAVAVLLSAVTTTTTGAATEVGRGTRAVQATVSGTGAVTATVQIYGNSTNSNSGGVLLATITLSGTTTASDGYAGDAPWPYLYAVVTAISGTSAAVTVRACV